ncbi:ABC transporter ATP-binding protein [Rhodococcus sp. 1163]|uniref:ABC transporter ATP-binding protein n=1 Tax=unclassified Rhodococcus (in: high G+C Gram-positive bacteria) TaxID=192944 RepID=UPI0009FFF065|nr:ATP-binding cassette domain-containing protein [Rhodococcus sp. 1163]ORI19160.1 ABC transporter ATP-binding protein [Rhodococcus sp. 1163]
MAPHTDALLSVDGITKRYGGVTAVDDVSFTLPAGSVLGLVGPNGAGKTTLVDCIVGTQEASSGVVALEGRALESGPTTRAQAGLARTFQHPQLALELTPVENIIPGLIGGKIGSYGASLVAMFRGLSGAPVQLLAQAKALAEEYGVTTDAIPAGDLSLGAQRLVEIARAMAAQPRVLLLDEPFAGSDPDGIAAISRAIRQVQESGRSVVLVDHNVDLIAEMSDAVVLLAEGRLVFEGTPEACMRSKEMQAVYFGTAELEEGK